MLNTFNERVGLGYKTIPPTTVLAFGCHLCNMVGLLRKEIYKCEIHITSSSSGAFYSLLGSASLHNLSKLIKSPLTWALYCMKNLAIAFTLVTFSTSTFACFGGPEQDLIILGIRLLALNAFLIFLSLTLRCIANFRDVFKSVTIVCAGLVLPIFMYLSTHGSGDCGEGDVVAFKIASIILCLVVAYELISLIKVRRKLQYNKLFKRDK